MPSPSPQPSAPVGTAPQGHHRPSRLYHASLWQFCTALVRLIPISILRPFASFLATLFWHLDPPRRRVVIHNLAPLLDHHPARAKHAARRLYHNFARKLLDLWQYEAGCDIHHLFGEMRGEQIFVDAINSRRGVLLVTPHLGNWEFGAPLMARHNIQLLALTLAEPHAPLTDIRSNARARHGVETLVIQQDPFAFLEVIRRLEQGQIVALLVDRPPSPVATTVQLCGQPIHVSTAPAEIARASGCVILPVYLLQSPAGTCDAFVLPPVDYDRAALRQPAVRVDLAQRILTAFEPAIRAHPDQWYHLVPVWLHPQSPPSPPAPIP